MNKNYMPLIVLLFLTLSYKISLGCYDKNMDIEEAKPTNSFSLLPDEILLSVFKFLPKEDLLNIRSVEKRCVHIVNDCIKLPKNVRINLFDQRYIIQYGYQKGFSHIKDPILIDLSQSSIRIQVLGMASSSAITASWLQFHYNYLRQATNLTHLNLSDGRFSSNCRDPMLRQGSKRAVGAECLGKILPALRSLKVLKLANCSLQTEDIRHIGAAFEHLLQLEALDLSENPLDDESTDCLITALSHLMGLKKLSLSVNEVSFKKSSNFRRYFAKAAQLNSLTLSGLTLTNGNELAGSLQELTSLIKLRLLVDSKSSIGYGALESLDQSLIKLTSLNRLYLSLVFYSNDQTSVMGSRINQQFKTLNFPTNLKKLGIFIKGNPKSSFKLPSNISSLSLTYLSLPNASSYNPKKLGVTLNHLSQLETLILIREPFKLSDPDDFALNLFKNISGLSNLQHLTLSIGMKDTALQEFTAKIHFFSRLKHINLSGERHFSLSGIKQFIQHLKPLTFLKTLSLSQAILLGERYYAEYYLKENKQSKDEENNLHLELEELHKLIKLHSSALLKFEP